MLRDWNSWTAHENQGGSFSCSPDVVKKVAEQLRAALGSVHPAYIEEIVPLNPVLAPKGSLVGRGWGLDPDPEDRAGNSFVLEHSMDQVLLLCGTIDDPGGRAENPSENIQIKIGFVVGRGNQQAFASHRRKSKICSAVQIGKEHEAGIILAMFSYKVEELGRIWSLHSHPERLKRFLG